MPKEKLKTDFVMLLTLDGWGIEEKSEGNPFDQAILSNWNKLISSYPSTSLNLVSYPEDYSRVPDLSQLGYYVLGTGSETFNHLSRINQSIRDKSFFKNQIILKALNNCQKNQTKLHLAGLLSDAEKYSSFEHLKALLKMAREKGLDQVYLHLFLDGVDTPKDRGLALIKELEKTFKKLKIGKIASLSGRFYAMDRNNYWQERTAKTYEALVEGRGKLTKSPERAIRESYKKQIFDKELVPTVVTNAEGKGRGLEEGDSLIFFNFRGDRIRQLAKAVSMPGLNKFPRKKIVKNPHLCFLTEYEKNIPAPIAFPAGLKKKSFFQLLREQGVEDLRLSEINKFAHINNIWDGFSDYTEPRQNRLMYASEKKDTNLSLMESTEKIGKRLIKEAREKNHNFILANLANFDISARQGNFNATVKYIEQTDKILGKLSSAVNKKNGTLILTSTAGWAENLIIKKTEEVNQDYTFNPLPVIIINSTLEGKKMSLGDPVEGDLSLLKPEKNLSHLHYTILKLLGLGSKADQDLSLL